MRCLARCSRSDADCAVGPLPLETAVGSDKRQRRERRQKVFPSPRDNWSTHPPGYSSPCLKNSQPTSNFVSFVGSCEVECCLQVDGNGIAQRMPRPLETSGRSAIESVDITEKGWEVAAGRVPAGRYGQNVFTWRRFRVVGTCESAGALHDPALNRRKCYLCRVVSWLQCQK